MNFQQAVRAVFSNYATFSGRARRAEYWWWVLFVILASLVINILDRALFGSGMGHMGGSGPLGSIFGLLILLPGLAVGARRLHDIDRTGWWLLIGLIPLLGTVVLIWFFATRGTAGPNRFGADPIPA